VEDNEDFNPISKPDSLLALHDVTEILFNTLREWFDIDSTITLDLKEIDSAVIELGKPEIIAAMAMRKLQALRLISTPGVLTTTDIVIAIINDLDRALLQAPSMYLERKADRTDWDQALANLEDSVLEETKSSENNKIDTDIEKFQRQHALLHVAVQSVVEAAEGEIRYFE
tara:strand:- start:569 stop:1081 length:513 start_codon:yes stop_codon:yes gene_type:complete